MRKNWKWFAPLACALGVACGDAGSELDGAQPRGSEEIINGAPASRQNTALQGAIFVRPGLFRAFKCGATYLGENAQGEHWALTAGHCVDQGGRMWVGFGKGNRNAYRSRDLAPVDRILLHGEYDLDRIQNDIAVVRLAEKPPRAERVRLAASDSSSFTGAIAEIVGFGRGTTGPLLEAYTRVISTDACAAWSSLVSYDNICVQDSVGAAQTACQGDSGGPLYVDGVQTGIASFVSEGCPLERPQAYVRVSAYRNWIRYATGGL